MKPCLEHWHEIAARIRERKTVFLALDFDGVLAPIAARPELAAMSPVNRDWLLHLSRSQRVRLAVVSGRSLRDVRGQVDIPGVIFAGNHGAEIDLFGAPESHVGLAGYRAQLEPIRAEMEARFSHFPGLLFEDKEYGIALHYRALDPALLEAFHGRFADWTKALPPDLHVVHGKKMYEIRPKVAWNKGDAILHIWQTLAPAALPFCVGDDLTDEDGFLALQGKGITIFVGEERQSYAEYILPSPTDVTTFLARVVTEVETTEPGAGPGL
jgi:trehalose-phosphatase